MARRKKVPTWLVLGALAGALYYFGTKTPAPVLPAPVVPPPA